VLRSKELHSVFQGKRGGDLRGSRETERLGGGDGLGSRPMLPERYRTCQGKIRAAKGLKGKEMEEWAKSDPPLVPRLRRPGSFSI
jgi:hypothetical protein